MSIEFYWVAVALTTIVSASRLTRLAVADKFPPVKWLRTKYSDATLDNDWWWLVNCGYCFSFWSSLFVVVWGWLAGVYDFQTRATSPALVWWIVNGILAVAYLAAVFMANDGDDSEDD